jgi:DNA-binding ferritin-like protein
MFKTPLLTLLACLRAQQWNYQSCHWAARGDSFYGDHLLFQRLYEGLGSEIDDLAELIAGYVGSDALDPLGQMDEATSWLEEWVEIENPIERGLRSEEDLQDIIKEAYEEIEKSGHMTYGVDDFLMALHNAHDKNVYLLKQRNRKQASLIKKIASIQKKSNGESHFFDNPQKRSINDFQQSGQNTNLTSSSQAKGAPPTPSMIKELEGGGTFSTLNRFVHHTVHPGSENVGHQGKSKHPKLARWNLCKPDTYTFLGEKNVKVIQ